jgi:phosphate transport system protein
MAHTVKAYDKQLDALERGIAEMGGIAEKMVIDAMDALSNADLALAHDVVATDARLDALQREIEDMAVLTIARRQPMAVDLRQLIGAMRVAGDLERVGDLAKNVAKRTIRIGSGSRIPSAVIGLKHMTEVALELLKDTLDAYIQRDAQRAEDVWKRDADFDALDQAVFRDLLTYMMEDPRNIPACALFCSAARTLSESVTTRRTSQRAYFTLQPARTSLPTGRKCEMGPTPSPTLKAIADERSAQWPPSEPPRPCAF